MVNYFKILKLNENASEAEIEYAYQQLRKNNSGSKISEYDCAYTILMDPKLRAIHLKTLNSRNKSLNYSIEKKCVSEVGTTSSLSNNIELLEQKILELKAEFNTPITNEYRVKLSLLHKERDEALKKLASQRIHAMQTRLKIPVIEKKINDKYDGFERKLNIEFSKKESQLKQQYKGKLLVEYIEYLPKQLELEKLMRDKRKLEDNKSVVQCVYNDNRVKKHR